MKVISLCLLVVASASFLLTTISANDLESYDNMYDLEWDVSTLISELTAVQDMEGEYMDVDSLGFISGCKNALWKGYKGGNGTICILREVVSVVNSSVEYLADIGKCTVNVPKDVLAIVNNAKQMITIGNNIVHIRSQLCASTTTTTSSTRGIVSGTKNTLKCVLNLTKATMSMVRRMNIIIKQSGRLPSDTATCFLTATHNVANACRAFLPNIDTCISYM